MVIAYFHILSSMLTHGKLGLGIQLRFACTLVILASLMLTATSVSVCARSAMASAPECVLEAFKLYREAVSEDEFEKAVGLFEKAVRLEADYIPARVWLGIAYMESDRAQERRAATIEQFEKALLAPDPKNEYERYKAAARQRLLRLRGRPQVIALCLETGFSSSYREAGERILDNIRSAAGVRAYHAINGDAVGYQDGRSETSLYASGRKAGVGWIALISVQEVGDPEWKTDKKGKAYWACPAVEVKVTLLDCELARSLPSFTARESGGTASSAEAALRSSLEGCGSSAGGKILGLVTKEDELVKEKCARSVPTEIAMVFAETSVLDRGQARELPVLVVPLSKSDARQSDEGQLQTATLAVGQTMRKELIGSGRFAVVSYSELQKLRDRRPSDWTPEQAIEFARSVGGKCQGVVLTRLTRCDAEVRDNILWKLVKATVELEATWVQVNAPPITTSASVSKDSTRILAGESLEEKKQAMLIDVGSKAAEEICRRIQTMTSPATIAVTDFSISKKVKQELASTLGSVQQMLIQDLQSGGQLNVPSAADVGRCVGTSSFNKDSLARLRSAGMTLCVRGEVKSIELKTEKKRDQPPAASVKVMVSAVLLDTTTGKELMPRLEEQSQQTADLSTLAKGAKPESSPEVQEAVKKAAEEIVRGLGSKLRDFILQHEDQF